MSASDLDLIPAGTLFGPTDIISYADPDTRDLDQAIEEADLLITVPHATAAIPEELAEFLSPELTRRLQVDFSDAGAASVATRWAQIDPRIVVVVNPHPRLVRDPNRPMPADARADLRRAFELVRAAAPGEAANLEGTDAIRPVTFSNFPILRAPKTDEEFDALADALLATARQGVDIYEATCIELTRRFLERGFEEGGSFTRLSFHDSMNTELEPDGAMRSVSGEGNGLPSLVALSNRGDAHGEQRETGEPLTLPPAALRRLAAAHRASFEVNEPDAVLLNQPYLGSDEIVAAGTQFRSLSAEAEAAGLTLGAVQAEFLRDYVLGPEAIEELRQPGGSWVAEDRERIDIIAYACKRAWDEFRDDAEF